jgi:hypothetical protein
MYARKVRRDIQDQMKGERDKERKGKCEGETHISEESRHVHVKPSERGLHAVDHRRPVGHDEAWGEC